MEKKLVGKSLQKFTSNILLIFGLNFDSWDRKKHAQASIVLKQPFFCLINYFLTILSKLIKY